MSEVIRGREDLCFTWLKALREMLVRRLGISLSDRERVIHDAEMIVTEIAAGEPRSTAANEVHGDSFAGSAPCNGRVETATILHTAACDAHRNKSPAGSCSGRGMMRSASRCTGVDNGSL